MDDIVPMVYVDIVGKNPKIIKESIAVSYTHLDVYKRQVSGFSLLSADFLSTPVFYFQNQHNDNAKVIDCQQTANKKYSVPR